MKEGVALAAVVGHPVAHSLSPAIFSLIAEREGRAVDYRRIDVTPGDFPKLAELAGRLDLFTGWNVTLPHKPAAARACAHLSAEARATGAVNVIHFAPDGLRGFNTDVFGIARTLAMRGVCARGVRAVVFGAGGAALAAGYALSCAGAAEIVFVNRTLSRARAAARKLSRDAGAREGARFRAVAWPGRFGSEIGLYVNATSLGMWKAGASAGELASPPIPRDAAPGAVAFDLVYIPEETAFLREARKRGLRAIGGLDMLIWQAIATWEIWFGKLRPGRARVLHPLLEKTLRAELRKRRRRR